MAKKIGLVVNEAWNMYNFRGSLMARLQDKGYELVVIAPKDEFTEKIEAMGIKVIDIKINSKGVNPLEDFKLMLEFRKIYKKERLDTVFHYTIKPIIYGTLGAALAKTKSVAVTTGLGYAFINENIVSKIVRKLYWFSLKFTKDVWFLNESDKEIFIKNKIIPTFKTKILPGEGIDLNKFKPLPRKENDKVIFLMVARALWDKGIKEYFETAKEMKKRYGNKVEFRFLGKVGVPNPAAVPMEYIKKYEDEGYIEYLGVTDDVSIIVKDTDYFVLPSYREGLSRVIMEAASMEKSIIASDVPGCRELVDDGISGFLCASKSTEELIRVVDKAVNLDKKAIKDMGIAGRKRMEKLFSMDRVAKEYLEFLEK